MRDDVVRFKLSRGGRVRRDADVRGLRRSALRAGRVHGRDRGGRRACRRPPRWSSRWGSTRSGSTSTAPTAASWSRASPPYATLNDAFEVRRRCRAEDAIYGLGEKTGRGNRKGRDFTLWNVDVLNPHETREFVEGRDGAAGGPAQHRVRPVLRLDPVLLPPRPHRRDDGGVVRRQRLPRPLRLPRRRRVRVPLRGRAVHGVRLRRAVDAGDPGGLHVADRPDRAAAAVGARLPPVPLVRLHAGRGRGARARAIASWTCPATRCGSTSSTWTATASSPGTPSAFPDVPGFLERLRADGLPRDHDRRPGRQVRAGLRGLRRRGGARRAVPDRGRRRLHRPGLAGRHRVPGLRHRGGPRVVGRAQRRPRASPGWPASGTT